MSAKTLTTEQKSRLVKFHGKFHDLVPNGFKFHKMFARNYRVYSRCDDIQGSDERVWVFQHHGGYIELNDFFANSKQVIDAIITGSVPMGRFNSYGLLLKTNELITYDFNKHDVVFAVMDKEDELGRKMNDEEYRLFCDNHHETIRRLSVSDALINIVKEMHEKGWIKI